ncbi:MAG: pseudaminic acid cytidylyltransferase [Lachnospiraceae bacterium]|nr:pseudaminic acid cytidylyltransferase [Lachnospiraceae bacterium]
MSAVAIITARGGSKRIPRKNIKDFNGRPIIAYSIEAALASGVFVEVMVSTDDPEIAEIAKRYGANVPFLRSAENADDHATTADVIAEVVDEYAKRGQVFTDICILYPTAPFITADRLKDSYQRYLRAGADALIPMVAFSFPPQRAFVMADASADPENTGRICYKWPEYQDARSQDLERFYHDAGQFYFVRADIPGRLHTVVPENTIAVVLDEMEVQDIDNETDWKLAELKWRIRSEK